MTGPDVDVVVLTWNDGPLLDEALASIEQSMGVTAHVTVVDNASVPPAATGTGLPVHWVRNAENRGVAPARNQGAAVGTAPYVCFLDSDARLTPAALQRLVAELERQPRVALAAPSFVEQAPSASAGPAPTLARKVLRVANVRDTYADGAEFVEGVRDVDFAIGACQVFRRSAFDQVGGLDEGYFYGPEDVDFCLRLREAGWRVVQVEAAAVHHPARRRFRGLATRRGVQHAAAVLRHLWRHRGFQRRVRSTGRVSTLDAVVVAYGNRDEIGSVVDDLRALVDGRVVVVDNGTDGSGDVAEVHGATVVRLPSNPGFGAGQNAGLACTSAPHVLLLNPDAHPDAAGITAGLAHLCAHPHIGAVQGEIVHASTGTLERSQGRELGPLHLLGRALGLRRLAGLTPVRAVARRTMAADYVDREVAAPVVVASLAATAPIVRRAALESVGGFDEGYFLYGEDLDLCRRLRAGGWDLVALPERFATHEGGTSSADWWAREVEWWRGTMRFAARWWSTPAWGAALAAAAVRGSSMTITQPRRARAMWRAIVADPMRARRSFR